MSYGRHYSSSQELWECCISIVKVAKIFFWAHNAYGEKQNDF